MRQLWTLRNVSTTSGETCRHPLCSRVECGKIDGLERTVQLGVGLLELLESAAAPIRGGRVELASAGRQIGSEDLGVPAAARPDFDDRVVRIDLEEVQGRCRIAIAVTGDVG